MSEKYFIGTALETVYTFFLLEAIKIFVYYY